MSALATLKWNASAIECMQQPRSCIHLPAKMLCVESNTYYIPLTKYKQFERTGCSILDTKSIRFSHSFEEGFVTIEFHFRPRTCARFAMHKHSIVFSPFFRHSKRETTSLTASTITTTDIYFVGHFFWILPRFASVERNVIICNIEPNITQQIIHCVRLCDNCDKAKKETHILQTELNWTEGADKMIGLGQTIQKNEKTANF